ncbi:OLC1v1000368C1 [Oldenlandia corymbosa var. corymbosa]|uniref:OLC1v1000368C1 n=1 Tax=Oldenlandia corymbosa var. corymbosa TaxID=529605 RepID=A0AAV1D2K2_OLDCO|nr:OLC1v1000368C1 [Oldenlandia corymbosa var. corymbosa]
MGGGRINNGNGVVSAECHGVGVESVSVQQVDAKVEALTRRFDDPLAVVNGAPYTAAEVDAKADNHSSQSQWKRDIKLDVDIINEFHCLEQSHQSVLSYCEKFEKMVEALVAMDYGFTEDYLICSFLSGLKEDLRSLVCDTKPKTLSGAFICANTLEQHPGVNEKLSSSEMKVTEEHSIKVDCSFDDSQKLHGLSGKKGLSIICCTGIPCSLLDSKAAVMAGCKLEETEPLLVKFVAGGYQAASRFRSRFKFAIEGHEFETDVRIVNLRGSDMVLGCNWVYHYDVDILAGEEATFVKEGKRFVLLMPSTP